MFLKRFVSRMVENWAFMSLKSPGDYSCPRRKVCAKISVSLSRDMIGSKPKNKFLVDRAQAGEQLVRTRVVTLDPIAISDAAAIPTCCPPKHNFYSLILFNPIGEPIAPIVEGYSNNISWNDLIVFQGLRYPQAHMTLGDFDDTNSSQVFPHNY